MRGNVLVRCGLELGGNPLLKGRNGRLPSISIIDRWGFPIMPVYRKLEVAIK
jgi:hypothetical protein